MNIGLPICHKLVTKTGKICHQKKENQKHKIYLMWPNSVIIVNYHQLELITF